MIYIKQILMNLETEGNIIILENLALYLHHCIDHPDRKSIRKQ